MTRQTKADLERQVLSLRTEARQNQIIHSRTEVENRFLKEENEKLKKEVTWFRQVIQQTLEIAREKARN